jgi:hypothetical protein
MRTKPILITALALLFALAVFGLSRDAGSAAAEDEPEAITLAPVSLRYDPTPNPWRVPIPSNVLAQVRAPARPDALSIIVLYNPATCPLVHPNDPNPSAPTWTRQPWPVDAEEAMDLAALIWSTLLNGDQPVIVHACWYATLGPNVLGQATGSTAHQNFPNAPQANTFYSVALANQLANSDLNGATPEIGASFSAAFSWYFGVDGDVPEFPEVPTTEVDFLSTALHEIGHGLGVQGGANWDNGAGGAECNGVAGNGCVRNPPLAYDRFVQSGGTAVVGGFTSPSLALGNALIGNNLTYNGAIATAANGGNPPRLQATTPWVGGSSYTHLDEAIFNNTVNALMTPALGGAEAVHYPGPVTLGLLADMGWQVNGFLTAAVDWSAAGFEDGSFDHPYNTVQEGAAAVRDDGLVYIAAGSYDERVTIARPMTLLAVDGVVKIGDFGD